VDNSSVLFDGRVFFWPVLSCQKAKSFNLIEVHMPEVAVIFLVGGESVGSGWRGKFSP